MDGETEVKDESVKLDRDSCRKIECITIPFSNDSQTNNHGWLVSSSADVPT